MKKLLLLAAFAGFAFTTAQAQEMRFGVKAGVNFANMSMKADGFSIKPDARTAFHIGALVEFPVSDAFYIQPEILYNSVGSKYEESYSESFMGFEVSGSAETITKLDYISIPIMAKYYFTEGFSLEAGPQIGFLMSAKADFDFTETTMGETISGSGNVDVKEGYKGIDFGLGIGASYRLDMGLFFSARYVLGLSDIGDDGNGNDDEDFDVDFGGVTVKNNVFQISVGYSF